MARRLEIELTSAREDGTWTWRAAGAREPHGVVDERTLGATAHVGDILRVEAEFDIDGISILAVLPPRERSGDPSRVEMAPSSRPSPGVTVSLVSPQGRGRGDRHGRDELGLRGGGGRDFDNGRGAPGRGGARGAGGRRPDSRSSSGTGDRARTEGDDAAMRPAGAGATEGRDRPRGGGPPRPGAARRPAGPGRPREGERPGAAAGSSRAAGAADGEARNGGGIADRNARSVDASVEAGAGDVAAGARPDGARSRPRPTAGRPTREAKPRPFRLTPGSAHRNEMLAGLTELERPIALQLADGGMPAVRRALDEETGRAAAEGRTPPSTDAIIAIADRILPAVKQAVWLDRAEAAVEHLDQISLRDLRATVAGAVPRDEQGRELDRRLREALQERVAKLREAWEAEIASTLESGRVLQALRLSGRLPEPTARFPASLVSRLAEAAGDAMTADVSRERWLMLLDAAAASPVRRYVKPQGIPEDENGELRLAARQAAGRIPALARLLGMAMPPPPGPMAPSRPNRPPPTGRGQSRAASATTPGEASATTPGEPPATPPGESPAEPVALAVAPTEEPVAVAPTEEPVAVAPTEEPVAVAPTEEPVAVAPAEPVVVASAPGAENAVLSQEFLQPGDEL